jgi:hypothetical protein
MRFLSPGFLFALLTIVIPIIIHLFNFRKFKKVYFSNVRFLKNVEMQSSSKRELRDRLILASRVLGLIFLVLAFARPYIPNFVQENAFQHQVISIYIDNSFSMEAQNKEGRLLDEAKRRAKEIVSAYNLNDKFQLLSNDFEGQHQRLLSPEDFNNAVDAIEISPARKNISQIISRQKDIFFTEPNSPKSIYLISDFQKNMLDAEAIPADSSIHIRLIRIKSNSQANISIDSIWFNSAIHRPGDAEKLIVRLKNNSDEEALNIPIKLVINNEQKALATLSIKARSSAIDTLHFSALKAGWQQAVVEISDFPLVFDDKFYFSFKVQDSMPILIVNGASENNFLNSLFQSDPFFKPTNVSATNLNYSQLDTYPIIILNEPNDLSLGISQQLQNYCQRGGHLIVFPNLTIDQKGLINFLQGLKTDVPDQLVSGEERVNSINQAHPLFVGVFDKVSQKLDLPTVKKYLRFTSLSKTNRKNILELPGNQLFFAEYAFGAGKIYLSAVPLNDESSNFARHAIFVPIIYQSALLSIRNQQLFYDLNRVQVIDLPKLFLSKNQTLTLRNENFETIPDLRQNVQVSEILIADQIKQSGNYQLVKNDSLLSVLSFNDAGAESDLSYASNREINAIFDAKKPEIMEAQAGSIKNMIKSADQGISLWKVCLILALLFFAAEILLIRFYNKTQIKPQIN